MTITDFIVFISSIFFLIRGALRGFMRSLIAPFSIIVTTAISIFYYKATADMITSLIIGLVGPLLLSLFLKFLLKIFAEKKDHLVINPSFLSRTAGAALTFAWGWVFIMLTLILLTVLPPWGARLTTIRDDVSASGSYNYIAKPWEQRFFSGSPLNIAPTAVPTTPETSNADAKSLSEDPRFQKILQDPEIQQEINTKDFGKLMSNPKMMALVQQLMNDPSTMKKVMALYQSQAQPKNP